MDNIHSATEGVWNGIPVTRQDMKDMADNFQKYSTGDSPYYRPFINLNHDDPLNSGLIVGARFDGNELHLDGDHIPEAVGAWANGQRLHGASIEFWQPKYDDAGGITEGFMTPEGHYSPTKVIKSLALLGNQAPGMKGMSELPVARFSDSTPTGGSTVNNDDLIAALVAQGFDATKLTDLPTLLQYLIDCKATPGVPASGDPAEGNQMLNPVPMADLAGVSAPAPVSVPSIGGGGAGAPAPTSLTLKFWDSAGKPQTGTLAIPQGFAIISAQDRAALDYLAKNGAAVAADIKRQRDQSKHQAIQAFGDRMATANMPPALIAGMKANLYAYPHDVVRKFADGKREGTALEEAIRNLENGAGVGFELGERIKQNDATTTQGGGGQEQHVAWDNRKKAMLDADPQFRQKQLKQERAKAGK